MKERSESIRSKLPPLLALAGLVLVWQLLTMTGWIPAYMLPSPGAVARAFVSDFPILAAHAFVSLKEAAAGLLVGILLAFGIAVLMERFATVERTLMPLLVISQTIPTIAIAPLLVLWMGFGAAPKITLVIITTFFPIAVGTLEGFKSADPDAVALLRSMGASWGQIFRHVKFPVSLPHFFSGLRVSASYAMVGAVISEWLGGFEGLGVYMIRVRKAYAFDKMFAVIIVIVIVSLLLMWAVSGLRRLAMPWAEIRKNEQGKD